VATKSSIVGTPKEQLVTTRYTYQILDQFTNELKEVYSYVDSRGTNSARVANLLVSEQLTPIDLPPGKSPPQEAENVAVTDGGRFNDTLVSERNVVFTAQQIIKVHTNAYATGNRGFGDTVRRNRISHTGDENVATEEP